MSSDDESRRRRQAFQGAISPAGVGTSISNQVSPDTLQDLLDPALTEHQIDPNIINQALQDPNIIDQAWQDAGIDLTDIMDWRGHAAGFPSLEAYAATLGIGRQTQNSPRGMGTPASHIGVPSADDSRNATGVGSVQGNRSRSRTRSRSRSPIRSSTPRADVPGAVGGRARQGQGPHVRGGLTRRSPRSPRSAPPSHHSSNHSSRSATPSHHSSNHSPRSAPPSHHSSNHSSRSATPSHHSSNHSSRSATPSHHSSNHSSRSATPSHHSSNHSPRRASPSDRPMTQADLQDRLRAIFQDHDQLAQGREIKNITVTNSVVTSYKQGGRPTVRTNSTRVSP